MAKAQETQEQAEKPKGGGKKLIIIIVVALVVVLLGAGALAFFVLSKPAEGEEEAHKEAAHEEDEHPPIYEKLETFTVNLADREAYLQVEIHLLVASPEIQEKIKQRMPEVRNDIISLLSGKMPDELAIQAGKDTLAEDVKKKINGVLGVKEGDTGVKKVLFNSFIIQ